MWKSYSKSPYAQQKKNNFSSPSYKALTNFDSTGLSRPFKRQSRLTYSNDRQAKSSIRSAH